jgi:sulfopyruvate decarboxylase subunit beta
MKRYDCLKIVTSQLTNELVVANVGGPRREWRDLTDHPILPVAALGLCSSLGLGLALALPHRRVLVLDGDGSALLNLSHMATAAAHPAPNLIHLIFDNEHYESSGVYPTNTAGGRTSLAKVASACGIPYATEVTSLEQFGTAYTAALAGGGTHVIVAKVEVNPAFPKGAPNPRPAMDPIEFSIHFARYIEKTEGISVRKSPRDVFPNLRW